MVFNVSGLLAIAEVAFRPHLLVPKIVVEDIRQLKLDALKARGVVGVVLDKDNCLTKPHHDALVQELRQAWPALVKAFGRENVLIVSNSAGTRDDAGFLQAESVSRHLGVPVLLHATKKPGCGSTVQQYFQDRLSDTTSDNKGKGKSMIEQVALDVARAATFSPLTPSDPSTSAISDSTSTSSHDRRILVIGDRVMTDVVLANRINQKRWRSRSENSVQAVSILTTKLWKTEGLGTRFMRVLESFAMRRATTYYRRRSNVQEANWQDCVTVSTPPDVAPTPQKLPIPTVRRPVHQYFSKQHIKYLLSRTGNHVFALIGRLLTPISRRVEPFLTEARQAQYGFRLPQSYQRTKLLRNLLNGQSERFAKK